MRPHTCCFLGEKNIPCSEEALTSVLSAECEALYTEHRITLFLCKNTGQLFDRAAQKAVCSLRGKYPLQLALVLPEHTLPKEGCGKYDLVLHPHDEDCDRWMRSRSAYAVTLKKDGSVTVLDLL